MKKTIEMLVVILLAGARIVQFYRHQQLVRQIDGLSAARSMRKTETGEGSRKVASRRVSSPQPAVREPLPVTSNAPWSNREKRRNVSSRSAATDTQLMVGGLVAMGFDASGKFLLTMSPVIQHWPTSKDDAAIGIGPIERKRVSVVSPDQKKEKIETKSPDGRAQIVGESDGIRVA